MKQDTDKQIYIFFEFLKIREKSKQTNRFKDKF